MNTTTEFKSFARTNRLRLKLDSDLSPIVVSRPLRGATRGFITWNRPGMLCLVLHNVSTGRSRSVARKVSSIACGLNFIQGAPPGEWVGEFSSEHCLPIAKLLGMVKKVSGTGNLEALKRLHAQHEAEKRL